MFYEDALTAARALELTLTSRSKDANGAAIPMCGVPFHAADGYIARLVRKGFRVAVVEQVEDPRKAKGLVRREVVRVVSPGTLTDAGYLEAREPAFLMALRRRGRRTVSASRCWISPRASSPPPNTTDADGRARAGARAGGPAAARDRRRRRATTPRATLAAAAQLGRARSRRPRRGRSSTTRRGGRCSRSFARSPCRASGSTATTPRSLPPARSCNTSTTRRRPSSRTCATSAFAAAPTACSSTR